jgi:prepilin-type processing-associated H-X9-DG protein
MLRGNDNLAGGGRARTASASASRPGFTLLEMLVIVATIALLVAILLPSLSNAQAHSRRIRCASNLKQIAGAWDMYLTAHQGRFLQHVNANYNYGGKQGSGSPQYRGLPKPLNRYLDIPLETNKGAEVFCCPSDDGGSIERPTVFDYYGTSYTTNVMLIGQDQLPFVREPRAKAILIINLNQRLKHLNRSRIDGESKLLLIGDQGWVHDRNATTTPVEWHRKPSTHNMAFMDGHVQFTEIRRGYYVTSSYTVIPFRDLQDDAIACQPEELE